jgi:hypothetical protein
MDYKYIEQLLERYWDAETSLEEESILRTFFSQKNIPAEMEHLRPLFADDAAGQTLGDDFDARILQAIGAEAEEPLAARQQPLATEQVVKAREVSLTQRLMPLFKAAAVIAIILTLGGALQAPWDSTWNTPEDYAAIQQADTMNVVPVQAEVSTSRSDLWSENMGTATTDSDNVMQVGRAKD